MAKPSAKRAEKRTHDLAHPEAAPPLDRLAGPDAPDDDTHPAPEAADQAEAAAAEGDAFEGVFSRPELPGESYESAAYARLCSLIGRLYREKEAADLIAAFDAAFAAAPDEAVRRATLDYWLDFYRLQTYKLLKQRRRSKPRERVMPCSACGYPSSHRHHLWDFATHGENDVTIQLCANCHELNHLIYNTLVRDSDYSRDIVRHVMTSGQVPADVLARILGWTLATIRYEADNGWLEGASGSRERVEARLGWSAWLEAAERASTA